MNKRIVYLSQLYEKIGDYLQKNGDAHVSSISTHCNHPEQIYYTLNLKNLKDDTERKIDVRYINVPIEQNETTENTLDFLCHLYIEDTSCEGQLFCGCYPDDCVLYKTDECINCLKKHIHKECMEESIKTMLKSKIERD